MGAAVCRGTAAQPSSWVAQAGAKWSRREQEQERHRPAPRRLDLAPHHDRDTSMATVQTIQHLRKQLIAATGDKAKPQVRPLLPALVLISCRLILATTPLEPRGVQLDMVMDLRSSVRTPALAATDGRVRLDLEVEQPAARLAHLAHSTLFAPRRRPSRSSSSSRPRSSPPTSSCGSVSLALLCPPPPPPSPPPRLTLHRPPCRKPRSASP